MSERSYRLFVDCTGQGAVPLDQFPFSTLVDSGTVVEASTPFRERNSIETLTDEVRENVFEVEDGMNLKLSGIAIDGYYRPIGADGNLEPSDFRYRISSRNGRPALFVRVTSVRHCGCDRGELS